MTSRQQRDGAWIAGLTLLAAAVRVAVWQRTAVLFNDGPILIGLARLMQLGEWPSVWGHPFHPLYSLAIWGAQLVVGDWERAAVSVSVLSGAASVAILYVFLRAVFDASAARIGALLLAVHPYAAPFSSDVLSDGLYLALFLGAVALGWRALSTGRARDAAATGAVAGLAYLTRPEGLGVVLVAGALAAGQVVRGRWRPATGLAWLAALGAGGVLLMAPYLAALHEHTGQWTLTRKKSLARMSGWNDHPGTYPGQPLPDRNLDAALLARSPFLETVIRGPRDHVAREPASAPPPSFWPRHAHALRILAAAAYSTLRPELLCMLVLGLWTRPRVAGAGYVLALVALYLAVLYALVLDAGYVSRRHLVPVVALTLGWVGAGVPVFGDALVRLGQRVFPSRRPPPAWLGAALATGLLVGIAAPKTFQARRVDQIAQRRAAEWLASREPGPIAAEKQRIAYFAGAPYVRLPRSAEAPVFTHLEATGARYLVVSPERLAADPALLRASREGMRHLHTAEAGGYRALVFAIGKERDDGAPGP